MASATLLLLCLAAAPVAPTPPEPPRVEAPAAPAAAPASGPAGAPSGSGRLAAPSAAAQRAAPAHGGRRTAPSAGGETKPTPHSLAPAALADELRDATSRRRQELAAIRAEREALEKLRADIAAARRSLAEETTRLEERLRGQEKGAAAGGGPQRPAGPAPAPGKGPLDTLARTLKGMKSEQAAVVVGRLEKPLAVELLRRMRPADAAQLLDRMKPEAAAEMVTSLALAGGRP